MGYAAGYADVVSEKTVKKFCPNELKTFKASLKEAISPSVGVEPVFIEEFAKDAMYEAVEDLKEEYGVVVDAYKALCEAFEKETGLNLSIAFHDQASDGDTYDGVDGAFWCVDGVWKLTPEGERMGKLIQRKLYVTMA